MAAATQVKSCASADSVAVSAGPGAGESSSPAAELTPRSRHGPARPPESRRVRGGRRRHRVRGRRCQARRDGQRRHRTGDGPGQPPGDQQQRGRAHSRRPRPSPAATASSRCAGHSSTAARMLVTRTMPDNAVAARMSARWRHSSVAPIPIACGDRRRKRHGVVGVHDAAGDAEHHDGHRQPAAPLDQRRPRPDPPAVRVW